MAKKNLSLKLLVDKTRRRVLFAEGGEEVVDFLFSLLALPAGAAASLLPKKGMVGSVGKLYNSVKRMDGTYLQAGFHRDVLLKLKISPRPSYKRSFECSETYLRECLPPSLEMVAADDSGGFVKGGATYMVMDDLTVEPMSAISTIALLKRFRIMQVGWLEERTVEFGMEEGLRLLKASFRSKTVLSDVFLTAVAWGGRSRRLT